MTRTPRRSRLTGLLITVSVLGIALAGCSSSNDAASTRSDDSAAGAARNAPDGGGAFDTDAATNSALSEKTAARAPHAGPDKLESRSVISTGSVALRSPDVAKARFDVQKVVDQYAGEVTEEQTDTDDDGAVERSRLVARIPTAEFQDAMADLEDAADLVTSNTGTDDVTTKVIDVAVRLRVQRRSIARVETLLDRAMSIRDVIAIEAQLSRRQAVLNSLERQQSYLADQTAMSTITVSLERTPEKTIAPTKKTDTTGFLPGLRAGWSGLRHVAVGVATVSGALLPFLIVLLVLLVPGWPLARRLRRRRTTSAGPVEA